MLLLSAFELQSPLFTLPLLPHLEELGYGCYWTTEHRATSQSASPLLLAGVAASSTKRIRVGTAGVKLRYWSPQRLAEDAHLLALLFPNRIELGTIGASESDQALHERLLCGGIEGESYHEKFIRLSNLLSDHASDIRSVRGVASPRLWMCSMSEHSLSLAANLSAGIVVGPQFAEGASVEEQQARLDKYRAEFVRRSPISQPRVVLVCQGICAASDSIAQQQWNEFGSQPNLRRRVAFLGSPKRCFEQLALLAEQYGTSDIAVQCTAFDLLAKMSAYEALARECIA